MPPRLHYESTQEVFQDGPIRGLVVPLDNTRVAMLELLYTFFETASGAALGIIDHSDPLHLTSGNVASVYFGLAVSRFASGMNAHRLPGGDGLVVGWQERGTRTGHDHELVQAQAFQCSGTTVTAVGGFVELPFRDHIPVFAVLGDDRLVVFGDNPDTNAQWATYDTSSGQLDGPLATGTLLLGSKDPPRYEGYLGENDYSAVFQAWGIDTTRVLYYGAKNQLQVIDVTTNEQGTRLFIDALPGADPDKRNDARVWQVNADKFQALITFNNEEERFCVYKEWRIVGVEIVEQFSLRLPYVRVTGVPFSTRGEDGVYAVTGAYPAHYPGGSFQSGGHVVLDLQNGIAGHIHSGGATPYGRPEWLDWPTDNNGYGPVLQLIGHWNTGLVGARRFLGVDFGFTDTGTQVHTFTYYDVGWQVGFVAM